MFASIRKRLITRDYQSISMGDMKEVAFVRIVGTTRKGLIVIVVRRVIIDHLEERLMQRMFAKVSNEFFF